MFVKPTHDHVPDPARGDYLPSEGRHVEEGPYWWRRVSDGDVVEAEPPPDTPPAPIALPAPTTESPPTAGSSASETAIPQLRNARKGTPA